MRTKMWLFMLLAVVGLNFNSGAYVPPAGSLIGDPFMGIQAVSRGYWLPGQDGEPDNVQCVDLAKDFAAKYYQTINFAVGDAAGMWTKGYVCNETVPP